MNVQKDKYIIVEIIPTHSNPEHGFIAQISALKLEGIRLMDRFDYRVSNNLIGRFNCFKGAAAFCGSSF